MHITSFSFYLSERLVHPLENVPGDPLVEEDPLGVGHVLLQLEERLLALLRLGHLLRGEEALQRGRVVGELFFKRGNGVCGGLLFFRKGRSTTNLCTKGKVCFHLLGSVHKKLSEAIIFLGHVLLTWI